MRIEPFRSLARAATWHRRLLAAGLAAGAAAAALQVLAPPTPARTTVLVARHDLAPGVVLRASDVELRREPPDAVPTGALRTVSVAAGRAAVGAVRSGEVMTDVRLLGPSLLASFGPGSVATPVRLADAEAVQLLRPGDRIDVLAAGSSGAVGSGMVGYADGAAAQEPARLVAADVPVVLVPQSPDRSAFGVGTDGALIVLATSPETAADLAAAAATSRITVTIRQ